MSWEGRKGPKQSSNYGECRHSNQASQKAPGRLRGIPEGKTLLETAGERVIVRASCASREICLESNEEPVSAEQVYRVGDKAQDSAWRGEGRDRFDCIMEIEKREERE